MKKYTKYIRITAIILILAIAITLFVKFHDLTVQEFLSYTPDSPFLAFLLLIFVYCLKAIIIGIPPLTVLYISAGIMFPTFWAVIITFAGLISEMSIGYLVGSRLGKDQVEKLVAKGGKFKKLLAPTETTFNAVCFIVRLLPGPLPLDIMSMLFGATRLSFGRYLIFSLLGVSPGMFAWVIAGNAITNPFSKEFLIPFSIGVGVSIITFIIFQFIDKKRFNMDIKH